MATLEPETRVRPDEEGDSDIEVDADADADADGDADPLFVEDGDSWGGSHPPPPSTMPASQEEWPLHLGSTDELYSDGLRQLAAALEEKYDLDNISGISYALAVNLNCVDGADPELKSAWCLLGDRNAVQREYGASGASGSIFYPVACHQGCSNFTSPKPPRFLQDYVLAVMKDNMSYQNDGASILSCEYFQGYSGIKPAIRYNPEDLLVTQGTATAALALPVAEARRTAKTKATQLKLLQRLQGSSTPDDPDASRPFARERQRIERAVATNEFGFRMEQVICVDVAALKPRWRHIRTVLRPIFQLMRFYLQDSSVYAPLMRRFRPAVFPGILAAYARVFDLATNEMLKRFKAQGSKGLGVALAEGVAALDRLGNYCFTGAPQVLMRSVLGPLGTMESITQGGWPFLDPQLLDIRHGEGRLNIAQWPRAADGRPIFMHIASLRFHYGPAVAASQHSLLWFRDLGGKSIGGSVTVTAFLEELFRELWIPQMVAYVRHQVLRRLSSPPTDEMLLSADGSLDGLPDDMERHQRQRDAVEAWAESDNPFAWSEYEPIWRMMAAGRPRTEVLPKSRHDFVRELYTGCHSNNSSIRQALSSKHSTWFAVLHAVIKFTPAVRVSEDSWQSGLRAALEESHIECMPGSHRSLLSARRVVRLVGNRQPPSRVLMAQHGSLKRDAMEAELRVLQLRQPQPLRQVIDFGEAIPFKRIPKLVNDGFASLLKPSKVRVGEVVAHYERARNCLLDCLGEPLCDLLLMLAVTYGSSSETPAVEERGKGFTAGKRKDQEQFAACLVTRMLWFLRPDSFPWKVDDGQVLRVSKMTEKIEHKGVNNRFLCEAGWVVTSVARPSPRNSEIGLQDEGKLQEYYKELLKLRKQPDQFIALVYRVGKDEDKELWVARSSTIIREQS